MTHLLEKKNFYRVRRIFLGELTVPLLQGLWTPQASVCILGPFQVQVAERKCEKEVKQ